MCAFGGVLEEGGEGGGHFGYGLEECWLMGVLCVEVLEKGNRG